MTAETWKKQGRNNFVISQALEAMALEDKSLSREQKLTLKSQAYKAIECKKTMEAMGWEFDPNKTRDEQIKGLTILKLSDQINQFKKM